MNSLNNREWEHYISGLADGPLATTKNRGMKKDDTISKQAGHDYWWPGLYRQYAGTSSG
jgi:hypothetical protein